MIYLDIYYYYKKILIKNKIRNINKTKTKYLRKIII